MINVGIIGCGYWGKNYIRVFNELQDVNVYACCDTDSDKLREIKHQYPDMITTTDYIDILANKMIDTVCIATPAITHYEITKHALLTDKDVLVEKPFVLREKQIRKLYRIVTERKRILMVGHIYLFNDYIRNMKAYLMSNTLGKIYYMYFTRINLAPVRSDVNVIWDLAVHDISIATYLSDNRVDSIRAIGKSVIRQGIVDVAFLTLKFLNGMIAHIHVSWINGYKHRIASIIGSDATITYNDVTKSFLIFGNGVKLINNKVVIKKTNFGTPVIEEYNTPLKNQCQHFIDCVQHRTEPLTGIINGSRVTQILEAAQISLESNSEEIRL